MERLKTTTRHAKNFSMPRLICFHTKKAGEKK